jgi:glycosyltransferase involved in cell wall biosynthesis
VTGTRDTSVSSSGPAAEQTGSSDEPTLEISVVTTVLNERKGIRDLLDSLVLQRPAHEVVVVDAGSRDGTWEILQAYAARFPHVRPVRYPGTRGAGRNLGVRLARAPRVAFIDGDCIANTFWLEALLAVFDKGADVVAGRTIYMGYWAFTNLHRVELPHKQQDTTWPSCNLAYDRQVFLDVGGFDERLITAEDIDLNYRTIDAGRRLVPATNAVVYARARDSVGGFLKQAYWNGYGRKQLTLKHGRLWGEYRFTDMLRAQSNLWGFIRLAWAMMGYIACKFKAGGRSYRDDKDRPATHNPSLVEPMDRLLGRGGSGLGAGGEGGSA